MSPRHSLRREGVLSLGPSVGGGTFSLNPQTTAYITLKPVAAAGKGGPMAESEVLQPQAQGSTPSETRLWHEDGRAAVAGSPGSATTCGMAHAMHIGSMRDWRRGGRVSSIGGRGREEGPARSSLGSTGQCGHRPIFRAGNDLLWQAGKNQAENVPSRGSVVI